VKQNNLEPFIKECSTHLHVLTKENDENIKIIIRCILISLRDCLGSSK
jgi:hypothetical protein